MNTAQCLTCDCEPLLCAFHLPSPLTNIKSLVTSSQDIAALHAASRGQPTVVLGHPSATRSAPVRLKANIIKANIPRQDRITSLSVPAPQDKDEMNFSAGNGVWIGAATLFIVIVFLLPLIVGNKARRRRRRLVMPFYNLCNFVRIFYAEPRSTLFHSVVHLRESLSTAHKASKKWLGRFHARWLRGRLWPSRPSLLPLHRMHVRPYHHSKATPSRTIPSFISLPYDIRFIIYEHFLRLFPCPKWNMTNTMQPEPDFIHAMALIRTCKLIRAELGPLMFQRLDFETDAKYPFYRNLPDDLTCDIRNLSLYIRPSVDPEFIHSALLQQLEHLRDLRKFAVTVAPIVLVDLDREFEHILHRFKWIHRSLRSLTVMARICSATAVDDLIVSQAMRRLSVALLPDFGIHSPVRASVWNKDIGKGRFRPVTGWYCRVSNADDPAWDELPDGAG